MFANLWNGLSHELSARRVGTEECTDDSNQKYEDELFEGEHERRWQVDEHTSLERNRPTHNRTDHHTAEATRNHKNESFVDIQLSDDLLCAAYCAHHRDFFTLLEKISRHWTTKTKEANEHSDSNDDVEYHLQSALGLLKKVSQRSKLT